MLTWLWIAWCVFQVSRIIRGKRIFVEKYVFGRNLASAGYKDLVIFLQWMGDNKIGVRQ